MKGKNVRWTIVKIVIAIEVRIKSLTITKLMHIHLGCDGGLSFDEIINFVKYFDQYVVLPSLLYDTDTDRRSLYGKAGCFRRTAYGKLIKNS